MNDVSNVLVCYSLILEHTINIKVIGKGIAFAGVAVKTGYSPYTNGICRKTRDNSSRRYGTNIYSS